MNICEKCGLNKDIFCGQKFILTEDKDFKFLKEHFELDKEDFTCNTCKHAYCCCVYAFDPYCTGGDCLASK